MLAKLEIINKIKSFVMKIQVVDFLNDHIEVNKSLVLNIFNNEQNNRIRLE